MEPDQVVGRLGLALRDLAEASGATGASLTFGGELTLSYQAGRGVLVVAGMDVAPQWVPDDALDDHGLVVAETPAFAGGAAALQGQED